MAEKQKLESETTEALKARLDALMAENLALKKQVVSGELPPEIAELVREKMKAGLEKDDAIQSARAQVAHDATNPHDALPVKKAA